MRRKFGPDQGIVESHRVVVRRCFFLVVRGRGAVSAGHDAEQLRLPMGADRERKRFDPIIHRIGAHGIHANHAVGQIHGGPRRLKQNADIPDGRIDILHLRLRKPGKNGKANQYCQTKLQLARTFCWIQDFHCFFDPSKDDSACARPRLSARSAKPTAIVRLLLCGGETCGGKNTDGMIGFSPGRKAGKNLTDYRRKLEPVAGEPACNAHCGELRMMPDDEMLVGGHGVHARLRF